MVFIRQFHAIYIHLNFFSQCSGSGCAKNEILAVNIEDN